MKRNSFLITVGVFACLLTAGCAKEVEGGQESRDLAISACQDFERVYESNIDAVKPGLDSAQEKAQMAADKATTDEMKEEYRAFNELLSSLQWMLLNVDTANTENVPMFIDWIQGSCAYYRE